jgi:hypothetical protein
MTPIDPFHVMTPYGPATCIGVLSHLEDVEWATFNNATQEMWFWTNPHIRRRINATNGFPAYSPFTRLNPVHRANIKRYIDNGWLPPDYDPAKPETWRL